MRSLLALAPPLCEVTAAIPAPGLHPFNLRVLTASGKRQALIVQGPTPASSLGRKVVCKKEAEKEDMIPNIPFFSYWTELEKRKLGIRKK